MAEKISSQMKEVKHCKKNKPLQLIDIGKRNNPEEE
jgi:hypothetical protein